MDKTLPSANHVNKVNVISKKHTIYLRTMKSLILLVAEAKKCFKYIISKINIILIFPPV